MTTGASAAVTEIRNICGSFVTMYAAVRAATAPGSRWDGVAIGACLLGTLCKETIVVTAVDFPSVDVKPLWRLKLRTGVDTEAVVGIAARPAK